MRRTLTLTTLLLAGTAPALWADGHAGNRGFALLGDGTTLVTMADIAQPGDVATVTLEAPVRALAWRPVTGALLGFADGAVYEIDPATGALTDLGASFAEGTAIAEGEMIAFDFNNAIDAVRAVSTAGDNLVYFPTGFGDNDERAGSVRRFTDMFYADGDTNAGTAPRVYANAYTNAIEGAKAGSTLQYALDAETDALVTLANNDGTLATIAAVTIDGAPVDLAAAGGFDIVSPAEGTDAAFAILELEGAASAGFYAIDLGTGAATLLADLGMGGFAALAVAHP